MAKSPGYTGGRGPVTHRGGGGGGAEEGLGFRV